MVYIHINTETTHSPNDPKVIWVHTICTMKKKTQCINSRIKTTTKSTACGRAQKAAAQLYNAGADFHWGRMMHYVVWKKSTQLYSAIWRQLSNALNFLFLPWLAGSQVGGQLSHFALDKRRCWGTELLVLKPE